MEWPKLKNIILLLLVTTNLCLLGFLVSREWKTDQQLREARTQAVEFLDRKEIRVAEGEIPDEMTLLPQTVSRSYDLERNISEALLGEPVFCEQLGGEVYRYHNDLGSIQFHADGTFSAKFADKAFPLGDDPRDACREILQKMDFHGVFLRENGGKLTFYQQWDGIPMFNQQVTLVCKDGYLSAMVNGRRLMGEPVVDETRKPITVASAIFDFYNGLGGLGDVCSRVDAIHKGYISTASLSGSTTLTPVWRIDTDTGRYQLDTVTGVLTRLG